MGRIATLNLGVGAASICFYICGLHTEMERLEMWGKGGQWTAMGSGGVEGTTECCGRMIRFEPGKRKGDIDIYLVLWKCQGPVFGLA